MGKQIKLSLVLLLLLSLICGCGDEADHKDISSPVVSAQPDPRPQMSPVPEADAEPETGLLEAAVKLSDNLLLIPNELTESAVEQNIGRLGDNILAWSYQWKGQGSELLLSLIDIHDGSTLCQRSFSGLEQPNVQLLSDAVAVSDWADGRVFILDEELEDRGGCELGQQGAVYLSPDCSRAYVFESERGIKLISLSGEEEERYLLENVSGLYPSGSDISSVGFSCICNENDMSLCGVLDIAAGEALMCPFDGMFYGIERSGDTWFGSPFGEQNTYYAGTDKYPRQFTLPTMSFAELLPDGRILVKSFGNGGELSMALFGKDGIFLSSCSVDIAAGGINGQPLWYEELGAYFLDVTTSDGSDRLLLWDISVPMTGQDLCFEPVVSENVSGSALSRELYVLADELGEKYGVEIVIAELCDTAFGEFSTSAVYDEEYIHSAMSLLDQAMGRFPPEFFSKLNYSVFSDTEIHLVGPLYSGESSGDGISFTNFVGAAVQENTENRIALDIMRPADMLEQTFYHELSHIIELRLVFNAANKGGSFSEERWNSLNPHNFSYYESKTGIPDSVLDDGFDAWFIDVYSRVNSSEDRARLFEYFMMDYDWAFASSAGRADKLEYYLGCIYECFGTEGWK